MVQTAIRTKTRVLPGKRIEVTAPELEEGEDVELIVLRSEGAHARTEPSRQEPQGVWDWLQSLPPVERTPEEWAQVERQFREDRELVGSLSLPPDGLVYTDAQIPIYTVDRHSVYAPVCDPLWQAVQTGAVTVVSSELTLLETLIGPLRDADTALAARREALWQHSHARLLPITRDVLLDAARLRAGIAGLKTPDAIHAATALLHGCALFLTNDTGFRRVPGLPLVLLDDVLSAP